MVWQKEVLGLSYKDWELSKCRSFNCLQDMPYLPANWCCKRKYPRGREFRKLTKLLELYFILF